jgi:predicted RNA binding protein YcfA (HicA-like mRNA interferase family)
MLELRTLVVRKDLIRMRFAQVSMSRSVRGRCEDVKVREIIRELEYEGWFLSRQRGSHRQFHHLTKEGCVTVPGALGDDGTKMTLASTVRQAGLERKRRWRNTPS